MSTATLSKPALTRDIEQAKRDLTESGYCLLADVITPDQRKRMFDRLMEQADLEAELGVAYMADGHSPVRRIGGVAPGEPKPVWQQVATLLNKGRAFLDLAMNPELHELSAHVYGQMPFDLSSVRGLIQRGGAKDGPIHIDQILVPFETPMPVVCNLTVALSDYTLENGATHVVPGSHRLRPPHMGGDPEAQPEVALEAPAGTAIVWEGRTWHRAAASRSEADRVGVVIVTNQGWVRQQDVYSASLHDNVYFEMNQEERNFVGFHSYGFNCVFPRFPGDRSNPIAGTNVPQTYLPELRRERY